MEEDSQMEIKLYLEMIETDIAVVTQFRSNPWLSPADVERLDREIAQYRAMVIQLRAQGW
jgi:hypothetical protein